MGNRQADWTKPAFLQALLLGSARLTTGERELGTQTVVTETADGLSAASEVPAGLTLVTLDNQADHFGEAQFVLLAEGLTGDDLLAALDSEVTPDWLYTTTWSGGPPRYPGPRAKPP